MWCGPQHRVKSCFKSNVICPIISKIYQEHKGIISLSSSYRRQLQDDWNVGMYFIDMRHHFIVYSCGVFAHKSNISLYSSSIIPQKMSWWLERWHIYCRHTIDRYIFLSVCHEITTVLPCYSIVYSCGVFTHGLHSCFADAIEIILNT